MRPTRALVDLAAIRHNVRALRECAGPGIEQMAVVKADGYGHGAVPVAGAALEAGATWLGVALVEEGTELREAGFTCPILVLGNLFPGDVEEALRRRLTLSVYADDVVRTASQRATALGTTALCHVKVDTGMGRLGLQPTEAVAFLEWATALPGVQVEGIFSHFATADEADLAFARQQLQEFNALLDALAARGMCPPVRHLANTAGTMVLPESHFNLVRTGIGIYGLYPSPDVPRSVRLRPAMHLVSRISHLKEVPAGTPLSYGRTFTTARPSRIATLPIGYGDGYPRLLSNRGQVLVGGCRVPIVGRVCMDMILADVSAVPDPGVGAPAVLFGRQGEEEISVDEIAALTGTINYEITCNVGKRVPREYR